MAEPVLISACLLGLPTRYDGESKESSDLAVYLKAHDLLPIPVCPEQLGGLKTPRPKAQIHGGQGCDVLAGTASVITECGTDVTAPFIQGAEHTWTIARICGCCKAILKEKSPSCGSKRIYQGSDLIAGQGVTATRLEQAGLEILSDEELL